MSRTSSQTPASAHHKGSAGSDAAAFAFDAVSLAMVESAPVNLLYCDRDLVIRYINPAALESLRAHETALPIRAHEVVGSNITAFHEKLADGVGVGPTGRIRRRARLDLVSGTLDLLLTPIPDAHGERTGAVVTWDVRASNGSPGPDRASVSDAAGFATTIAEALCATASRLRRAAHVPQSSGSLAGADERMTASLDEVARSADEFAASGVDIGRRAADAAALGAEAARQAEHTALTVARLGESAAAAGRMADAVTSMAQHANLLAINATIEAARVGDAGKGFAVVAHEVKDLARVAARTAVDLTNTIETIRDDTKRSADAMEHIVRTIARVTEVESTVCGALERQMVVVRQTSRALSVASREADQITTHGPADMAQGAVDGASAIEAAAEDLARLASRLEYLVADR